jgi:hypothetical protein
MLKHLQSGQDMIDIVELSQNQLSFRLLTLSFIKASNTICFVGIVLYSRVSRLRPLHTQKSRDAGEATLRESLGA